MAFLSSLGDGNFKMMADGRRAFFPYGPFSRGWIVDSEETYRRLVSHQSSSVGSWIVLTPLLVQKIGWLGVIGCWFVWSVFVHLKTQRLIRNLEPASERFTYQDVKARWAESFALSAFTLWFLFVVGLLLSTIGVLLVIYAPQIWLIDVGFISLGAAFMFLSIRQLPKDMGPPL